MVQKKTLAIIAVLLSLVIGLGAAVAVLNSHVLYLTSKLELNTGLNKPAALQPAITYDTTVWYYKNGKLYAVFEHPGTVTNLGKNFTLGKITGDADYNMTQYLYNATFVSIGNQGSLSAASTVLPAEWNRTAGSVHDVAYNTFNVTAVFYPDAGPYTADCFGLNFGSDTIGEDYSLFGYDTFNEVTGIDDTFTINVEIQVTIT